MLNSLKKTIVKSRLSRIQRELVSGKTIKLATLFILVNASCVFSQHVMGTVVEKSENGKEVPVVGANVYFMGTTFGTTTDETGMFMFNKPDPSADTIIISYIGYANDTVKAEGTDIKVILKKSVTLKEVEVKGKKPESFISRIEPIKTEVLTTAELEKNACCNLSESFESNPTVDVSFSDAVTGARQIQMLGLSGTYVQSLVDVLPTIRGLNTTFGFNYIPGPWAEDIYVGKGTGSVVNGYESITGQIDVELKKPEKTDKLFLNLYGNSEGRAEANLNYRIKVNEKWSTLFLLNGNALQNKMDNNNDNFIDQPVYKQYDVMNRWKFDSGKRVESMFGIRYLQDDRTGGDIRFNKNYDKLTTNYYGLGINTKRIEAFTKTSLGFYGKEYQSLGLQVSAINHEQNSYYGLNAYTGKEQTLYTNLIYQNIIGDTRHKFKTGMSFMQDNYDEQFGSMNLKRNESVPGAFFEYTYDNLKKWTVVAGMRGDYYHESNSSDFPIFYSPRLHARYKISENSTLRASAGRGYHVANIFAENSSLLASSREIILLEKLKPEHAWNYGLNFTHNFLLSGKEGTFSIDAYRTDFTNQVIVDLYADATKAYFFNLNGNSFSNSLQAELSYELLINLKAKVAWKFYDVQSDYLTGQKQKPLSPSQRGLFNIAYETPNGKWKFDFTTQYVGEQKLPRFHVETFAPVEEWNFTSPSYFRMLGQITFIANKWEFYSGCENIGDYMQHNPVLYADDPFGKYFDTSVVWGPITGRMFYAGLRFAVN
ncbi:MAG: TonB-dependent receptor domain-containing protein [Bacteroidia bacterium]